MSSGFNTDVTYNGQVFHIQTEDRGDPHRVIDTALYQNGRVLLRKSFSYADLARSAEFTPEWLRQRVEEHHRFVIEDLRAGLLDEELVSAREEAADSGLVIQLLNPNSWLSDGTVSLDIEILRKLDRRPQAGAQVEAEIEGAAETARHTAVSDGKGQAKIRFPLPPLGSGDLALVISASNSEGSERIRFAMRSKAKDRAESAAPQS